MKVYGIKNCSTVKKALAWLDTNHIAHEFHDFKKLGIDDAKLKEWADQVGLERLINKRGTTWKALSPDLQQLANTNSREALKLMQEKTSIIKRPVLETSKGSILGFDEALYTKTFKL